MRIAAGLAALGVLAGAGAVTYDSDGSATVTVKDQGIERKVTLPMQAGGPNYKCPDDIKEKLSPYDILAGRMRLASQDVRRDLKALEARYPDRDAPVSVIRQYHAMAQRDDRLVNRYNRAIDKRNAAIAADCSKQ